MAKIEIEGAGVRISVEGLPEDTDKPEAWGDWIQSLGRNWKDAVEIATRAEIERREPNRTESGSAGFTTEQANDWRNSRLLGDEFAGRPGFEGLG